MPHSPVCRPVCRPVCLAKTFQLVGFSVDDEVDDDDDENRIETSRKWLRWSSRTSKPESGRDVKLYMALRAESMVYGGCGIPNVSALLAYKCVPLYSKSAESKDVLANRNKGDAWDRVVCSIRVNFRTTCVVVEDEDKYKYI